MPEQFEKPAPSEHLPEPEAQSLSEQRQQLFQDLREKQKELNYHEKVALCGLIFQHSLEDGVEVAEYLHLSDEQLTPVFAQERFALCHPEFLKKITDSLLANQFRVDKVSDKDEKIRYSQLLTSLLEKQNAKKHLNMRQGWEVQVGSHAARLLYLETEAYYARLLGARVTSEKGIFKTDNDLSDWTKKIKSKEDSHKDGVQIGEDHVRRYEHALSGDYLSGEIYKLAIPRVVQLIISRSGRYSKAFYDEFCGHVNPAPKNEADFWNKIKTGQPQINELITSSVLPWHTKLDTLTFFSPLIAKETAEEFLKAVGFDQNNTDNAKKLEAARYKILSPISTAAERSATKYLQQEIKGQLKLQGHNPDQVRFDRQADGGYKFINTADAEQPKETEEFNWDLSTFETYEFNAGPKDKKIEKIYQFGETTVIKYKRGNNYVLITFPDEQMTQLYKDIEPIGVKKEGVVSLVEFTKDYRMLFINDSEATAYSGYKFEKDSVLVVDGKLAFVGERPDGIPVFNIDGKEHIITSDYTSLRKLRYSAGAYFCCATRKSEPTDSNKQDTYIKVIPGKTDYTDLYNSTHIEDIEIFGNTLAIVRKDQTGYTASIYRDDIGATLESNIAQNSIFIDIIKPHPAFPGPIFWIAEQGNTSYFRFPDGSESPKFHGVYWDDATPNTEDFMIPCIDARGNTTIYSLRERKEMGVTTTKKVLGDPQSIDEKIIYNYIIHKGADFEHRLYAEDATSGLGFLTPACDDQKFLVGPNEVVITEVRGSNIKIHRKKRSAKTKTISGDIININDPILEKKYELLNLIGRMNNSVDTNEKKLAEIKDYFFKYNAPPAWTEELRSLLSSTSKTTDTLNKAIREHPELFLDTIAAVPDRTDNAFVERVIDLLFPKIAVLKAKERNRAEKKRRTLLEGLQSLFGKAKSDSNDADYLASNNRERLEGGDPMEKGGREIMRFRELPPGMIATEYLGKYDGKTNTWQPLHLPVTPNLEEPVREYTAEIPITPYMREVRLPLAAGGRIIPERIKGRRKGNETLLEGRKEVNGLTTVPVTGQPEIILYSQQVSTIPAVPGDISQRTYNSWKKHLEKQDGGTLLETVGRLAPEEKLFLSSIENLTPKEKLIAIQEYVQRVGYYDFANAQMQEAKRGQSVTDNFALMRDRMKTLQKQRPELKEERYAGVCTDFALLGTSLLREAGFVSGVVTGFNPTGNSITSANAHAASFVLWPDGHGENHQLIVVDFTPANTTLDEMWKLNSMRLPSLRWLIEVRKSMIGSLVTDAREKLKSIEELDADKIAKLTNGDLERAVNTILRYDVKQSHVEVLREILNTAAYSPAALSRIDMTDPEDRVEFLTWMRVAIDTRRQELSKTTDDANRPAGTELIHLITEFKNRFTTDIPQKQIFDVLQNIMNIARDYLEPNEHRAATAVITYLKAKKMKKDELEK